MAALAGGADAAYIYEEPFGISDLQVGRGPVIYFYCSRQRMIIL